MPYVLDLDPNTTACGRGFVRAVPRSRGPMTPSQSSRPPPSASSRRPLSTHGSIPVRRWFH